MINLSIIEQAKSTPITAYLQSLGIYPAHKINGKNQYSYCSPLSGEKTPSFFVNENKNVFYDYSTGERGDVIRLAQLIEPIVNPGNAIDFVKAVKLLVAFNAPGVPLPIADQYVLTTSTHTETVITAVKTLQNPALLDYVERQRRIPFSIANEYVKEIHYQRGDKRFYGVGFRSDVGSWAIRSERFRTWIGAGQVTTFRVDGSTDYNLFEGFFDFLSALVWFRVHQLRNNTIVLNSNSHLSRVMDTLKGATNVYTFLDLDGKGNNGGLKAMQRLRDEGVRVTDRANIYAGYNDFNEFLQTR